jgi:hypothetical protein
MCSVSTPRVYMYIACSFETPRKVSVQIRVATIKEQTIVSDVAWEMEAMVTRASLACAPGAPPRSNGVGHAGKT